MAEPIYKTALSRCRSILVEDLASDELLDQFMDMELLPRTAIRDCEDITIRSKRNREILGRLMMSGPEIYEKFKQCLRNTKQTNLVERLEEKEREAEREAEERS